MPGGGVRSDVGTRLSHGRKGAVGAVPAHRTARERRGDGSMNTTRVVPEPDFPRAVLRDAGVGVLTTDGSGRIDRKSTRLNSSHVKISYAVFCLKKKIKRNIVPDPAHP